MEAYIKLTERQKEIVQKYVEDNIYSVFDERSANWTSIDPYEDGCDGVVYDDQDVKTEFVERNFVGYYCNKCGDYVAFNDNDLIKHVIKDIEKYADEYEWEEYNVNREKEKNS